MPKKQKAPVQPDLLSQVPNEETYHNQRLFSDHYLENILPHEAEWAALRAEAQPIMAALKQRFSRFPAFMPFANEAQTEDDWVRPVLELLGHTYEVQAQLKMPGMVSPQHPDYVFYASADQQLANRGQAIDDLAQQRGALAVGDAKQWDVPLDQMSKGASTSFSNKNPSFQIFFYMLHSKLPWGILTNGRKWRLYHEDTAYKLEVYYEVDLPDLLISAQADTFSEQELERFLSFYAFFRRAAFDTGPGLTLARILHASASAAQTIRENLREQVYEALLHVAQGFLQYPANRLTPTPETCQIIYENSLILLYRLLFILYAEARGLLPVEQRAYEKRYSLLAIKQQIVKALREEDVLLPDAGIIWAQLQTLFRGIDQGNKKLGISTFNGGLFYERPGAFLARYTVGDLSLARAIDKLARAPEHERDFSEKTLIDYRDLSERHLGTIYEGLLEYTLHVASEPMAELRATGKIVPLTSVPAGSKDIVRTYQLGEPYLVTDTGERKKSGSYYTPDYIVKYMVEQTLQPLLQQRLEGAQSDHAQIASILALNVLDPAMGSGHFPVEVVEYLARYLVGLGVQPEDKSEAEADMTYWKRRVAQHCIYGVDFNPLAVELAKLSLWLATAAKGYPLNFLDHHLRPGNALVGAWLEEVATEHPKQKLARLRTGEEAASADMQPFSLWEQSAFTSNLSDALNIVRAIEQTPGNTITEVKQQEAAYATLRALFSNKYRDLLHLGVAQFYDLKIEPKLWGAYAAYSVKSVDEQNTLMGAEKGYLPTLQQARALGEQQRFFHWELEFPEIFFAQDGTPRGEQAGFDAIVGNPPYVRQERLSADKPFYQEHHEIYHGSADLFVYFFAQGLRLLRPGGRLSYISSNSWLRANYATPLRRYLRTQTSMEQIIDLGNTRVFADAPDLSPAIHIVRKALPDQTNTAQVALFSRGDDIKALRENIAERFFAVALHDQPDEGWQLKSDAARQLFARLMERGQPLGELVAGRMYRGVLTGLNEAFIIDTATRQRLLQADPASAQLIKPMVRGEDLRPWYQENEGRWLIFVHREVDITAYPAIRAYLEQFRERLEPRPKELDNGAPWSGRKAGAYQWYQIQDTVEYAKEFEKTKIFYPDITKKPRFSWGEPNSYASNTGYFIPTEAHELLGILNSRVIWFVISYISQPLGERKGALIYRLFTQCMERLPIPALSDEQRTQLGGLAQQLTNVARERYRVHRETLQRIRQDLGAGQRKITDKLAEWWRLDWSEFLAEVRKSFKREIALKERGAWETFLDEQRAEVVQLTGQIVSVERQLNRAVYAVFGLHEEEIALIERETKYQYGEW